MSQKGPQPDFSWVSIFRAAMLVMRATQRNEIIGGRDDFGPIVRRLLVLFGGAFRSMKAIVRRPRWPKTPLLHPNSSRSRRLAAHPKTRPIRRLAGLKEERV